METWRRDYNEFRPHSSLGNMTLVISQEACPQGQISQITEILTGPLFGGPSNGLDTNLKTGPKNGVRTA